MNVPLVPFDVEPEPPVPAVPVGYAAVEPTPPFAVTTVEDDGLTTKEVLPVPPPPAPPCARIQPKGPGPAAWRMHRAPPRRQVRRQNA